ncbi:MAG TPA: hypothetical protein VN673_14960 [Clostridia bacterium]|nr:hypothetical protein [Clostridia bacterium]
MLERKLGERHCGKLRMETAQAKAERIIAEELAELGWDAGRLERFGDVFLAHRCSRTRSTGRTWLVAAEVLPQPKASAWGAVLNPSGVACL